MSSYSQLQFPKSSIPLKVANHLKEAVVKVCKSFRGRLEAVVRKNGDFFYGVINIVV